MKAKEKIEKEIEKEILEKGEKEIEKEVEREIKRKQEKKEKFLSWEPKTRLGKDVKSGKIKEIDFILDNNLKILEEEISDALLDLKTDLFSIGQSKGKFGGGKRRAWRQTQRKKKEGNVPTFSALAVVGDENGHVGIGSGKATETLPARDKALRKAKLNLIKVKRTCASFDCACSEKHTIPFKIEGKAGSVKVILIPAPQGTGLVVANELKKILKLAGIKDVYSKTFGKQRTTFNLIKACFEALKKTNIEEKLGGNLR
jgi:small subunit ribosomal protein S5